MSRPTTPRSADPFDLSTRQGMANSVAWLNDYLEQLKEGGTWMIPRSGTVYNIRHSDKTAIKLMATLPDPALDKVFRAAGWKVVDNS